MHAVDDKPEEERHGDDSAENEEARGSEDFTAPVKSMEQKVCVFRLYDAMSCIMSCMFSSHVENCCFDAFKKSSVIMCFSVVADVLCL